MAELLEEATTSKHVAENAQLLSWVFRQFKGSTERSLSHRNPFDDVASRADEANNIVGRRLVRVDHHQLTGNRVLRRRDARSRMRDLRQSTFVKPKSFRRIGNEANCASSSGAQRVDRLDVSRIEHKESTVRCHSSLVRLRSGAMERIERLTPRPPSVVGSRWHQAWRHGCPTAPFPSPSAATRCTTAPVG